jgi:hypothetical protein
MTAMAWPLGEQFTAHLARTEPGPGVSLADEGIPGSTHMKLRSIPNVSTPRLERRLEHLHGMLHTTGLPEFHDTKRSLVEQGVHARSVAHELVLRQKPPGQCRYCWGHS